jgi:hypothetical protein
MRAFATILLALSAALLAAGCDDDGEGSPAATTTTTTATTPTSTTATAGAGDALVVYERAGGVAYTEQRLVVDQDGSAAVDVGGPEGFEERFRLDDTALDAMNGLLRNAEADLENSPGPSGCADCYEYRISYQEHTASYDDTNLPPGVRALVELFGTVIERETPSGPARGGK